MQITIHTPSEKLSDEFDYRRFFKIKDDTGKVIFKAMEGEPEDAVLARDFNDVYRIPELMRLAYDAGKAGEPFNVLKHEDDEWS